MPLCGDREREVATVRKTCLKTTHDSETHLAVRQNHFGTRGDGATENARPENAGLENDRQNCSQLWAKLRGLENAGLENDGPCFI